MSDTHYTTNCTYIHKVGFRFLKWLNLARDLKYSLQLSYEDNK